MKKFFLFLGISCILSSFSLQAQVRNPLLIPDLPGYTTLKCDFHMHSVFSDGLVWPSVRAVEAYTEGLDAIALTDHIEYRPNHKKGDLQGDFNRSFDIMNTKAKALDIIAIRGSEITRPMPPGHWNAIFMNDCNKLDTVNYEDAFKEAISQGAFLFWNHPGWYRQAYDTTVWLDTHTELYNKGYMHGIEVANGACNEYYPEAHQWALDKNLTILGNTDMHPPMGEFYDFGKGQHRTMTLVFAKEKSLAGIREALDSRRTIAWHGDLLIGREALLRQLFDASFEIKSVKITKKRATVVVKNNSDLPFILKKKSHHPNLQYFRNLLIKPRELKTIAITFVEPHKGKISLDFVVDNFYVAPFKGLECSYELSKK